MHVFEYLIFNFQDRSDKWNAYFWNCFVVLYQNWSIYNIIPEIIISINLIIGIKNLDSQGHKLKILCVNAVYPHPKTKFVIHKFVFLNFNELILLNFIIFWTNLQKNFKVFKSNFISTKFLYIKIVSWCLEALRHHMVFVT